MMNNIRFLIVYLVFSNFTHAQTVTIGTQVWMTKNLNVSTFRNGDTIPEAKTNEEWEQAGNNKQPAWCYHEKNPNNIYKYGKLYNWYAVNDPRGLAPVGFHVPSDSEWTILSDFLGGEDGAGLKMKTKNGWLPNGNITKNGNGTNSCGFLGFPYGDRNNIGGFSSIGNGCGFWSSSKSDYYEAWGRFLNGNHNNLARSSAYKEMGISIRCIKD